MVTSITGGFETERLRIAPCQTCLQDQMRYLQLIEELTAVLTPNVLLHLPEPLQLSDEQAAVVGWIAARDAESDVYTVREQGSDILLGLLILAEFREQGEPRTVHIGYLFSEEAWGRGYASELLMELVRWQRNRRGAGLLLGGVEKNNPASAKVLTKSGFVRNATLSNQEIDMFSLALP